MGNPIFLASEISPTEVLAGDSVEITIRLVLGPDFRADGSRIVLDMPAYLGYSRPSCFEQEVDGFMEVLCSNPDIVYRQRVWDVEAMAFTADLHRGNAKSAAQRMFVVDFVDGRAEAGDEVLIKWGYTRDGFGTGVKVTPLVLQSEFYNTIEVRYFRDGSQGLPDLGRDFTGYERPQPDAALPLRFRIVPREPEKLRVIRSARKARLLVLDRFSNPCPVDDVAAWINEQPVGSVNAYGVYEIDDPAAAISSRQLPLFDAPTNTNVFAGHNIYFGDLHVHSSASADCSEREKSEIDAQLTFAYGKYAAGLDFMAVTDHHGPDDSERHKIGRDRWNRLNEAVDRYTRTGEFLAFAGFEFSCARGDTVVLFNESVAYSEIDDPGLTGIERVWKQFRGKDFMTIPHLHNVGSLAEGEWIDCPDEGVEPVLEVNSCIGSYESQTALERGLPEYWRSISRPDRNARFFLDRGCRYGLICNSDGHKGHPGKNGLIAVYAKELTKSAIFEAIRKRQTYGTTNARIRLLFTINQQLMGAAMSQTGKKEIHISVMGERPFKAVDLIRNGELHTRFKPYSAAFATDITANCSGRSYWYVRATQIDNHIAYSSPIWFE